MNAKIEIVCSCIERNVICLNEISSEYFCNSCGKTLFKIQFFIGYVYLLSNSSMPNLLKIGYTERNVNERIKELNSTGVPVPFEIEAIWESSNPKNDEEFIHKTLNNYRVSSNREFFSIGTRLAVELINNIVNYMPVFLRSPDILMTDNERNELIKSQKEEKMSNVWVSMQLSQMDSQLNNMEYYGKFVRVKPQVLKYFYNIYQGIHEEWMEQLMTEFNLPCPSPPPPDWFEKLKKEQDLLESKWRQES